MGDMRRAVSETVLNKASSRSHAIFTMHVQAAKVLFIVLFSLVALVALLAFVHCSVPYM